MNNQLTYLIIHCTATPDGRNVTKSDIERWHLQERKWSKVGYSELIDFNGNLIELQKYDTDDVVDPWEITNGVAGKNSISRHIVYAGGLDKETLNPKDTRNTAQLAAMSCYLKMAVKLWPNIIIAGHNNFAARDCPSFDVPAYCKSIGIHEKNIFKNAA
jgi:hypothetical protein